jgi:hypothetical protein
VRTFYGMRHGFMASFSCSVARSTERNPRKSDWSPAQSTFPATVDADSPAKCASFAPFAGESRTSGHADSSDEFRDAATVAEMTTQQPQY